MKLKGDDEEISKYSKTQDFSDWLEAQAKLYTFYKDTKGVDH